MQYIANLVLPVGISMRYQQIVFGDLEIKIYCSNVLFTVSIRET